MDAAVFCVVGAALCSGTAIVLQAVAARRLPAEARLDAALVGGLARNPLYLLALLLVATGFALSFVALRSLPLFAVQAGRASSLAVAALLAVAVLGARLRWTDWLGLAGLGVGLVVLASTVESEPASAVGQAATWVVVAGTVALGVAAVVVALGPPTPRRGLALAVLAGVAFAVLALGARTAPGWAPLDLLAAPVVWCAAVSGGLGLAASAIALRRAPVVAVTAVMVAVETVVGALLGILLAGDRPAPGTGVAAAGAFLLVLAGAVVVARFGTPETVAAATPVPSRAA